MIVWGGEGLNSGGIYDPAADSWSSTPPTTSGAPGPGQYSAVWSGSKMLVWGCGTILVTTIKPDRGMI